MNYNHDHDHGQYQNPEINLIKSKLFFNKLWEKYYIFGTFVPCPLDMIQTLHQISQVVFFWVNVTLWVVERILLDFPRLLPAGARLEMENRQLG